MKFEGLPSLLKYTRLTQNTHDTTNHHNNFSYNYYINPRLSGHVEDEVKQRFEENGFPFKGVYHYWASYRKCLFMSGFLTMSAFEVEQGIPLKTRFLC
jgi:hypothetical protein